MIEESKKYSIIFHKSYFQSLSIVVKMFTQGFLTKNINFFTMIVDNLIIKFYEY